VLAYEMNGQPLLPQHGFPLRMVVPGWYGMTNVKWLEGIEAVGEPFSGYQQTQGYRLRQDENDDGEPVSRMLPRALMVPPGDPDFFTRERIVKVGACSLAGRAWSGRGAVVSVEVSTDGGTTWDEATLAPEGDSRWAWRGWAHEWVPEGAGTYELCCRARDDAGNEQPVEAAWNLGGYSNNAVQRIPVTVAA
jgi:sulfane dehydrogenase subunit SoxC